jgi:hypothetical protein
MSGSAPWRACVVGAALLAASGCVRLSVSVHVRTAPPAEASTVEASECPDDRR